MRIYDVLPFLPVILFLLFWILVVTAWGEGIIFRIRRKKLVRTNQGCVLILHDTTLQMMREGAHPRDIYIACEKLTRYFAEYPFENP